MPVTHLPETPLFNPDADRALAFARTCPIYAPTAVHAIDDDGVTVTVKDESTRFGLGSFKALGGIHAVGQMLLEEIALRTGTQPAVSDILNENNRAVAADLTFVCASAGNHGLAVATGAQLFGAKARIHVSTEVPSNFATRLEACGAQVCVSGDNYEESVEAANVDARETGAWLLADGSWEGYLRPPAFVMEGYTVMAAELCDTFTRSGNWPSDVYLQAGVGGMAAAVTFIIRRDWLVQPRIVIVEPTAADCLALSAAQGQLTDAVGPVSNMGRLDCKAASLLSFDTLARSDVEYLAISDEEASAAVTALGRSGLRTTPSGAAGFAGWQRDLALDQAAGRAPLVILSEQAID